MLRRSHVAWLLGLASATFGCSGSVTEEAPTGRSESALGLAAVSPPNPRRIIRVDDGQDCDPIAGSGGTWSGAWLTAPIGQSDVFCTYAWSPSEGNTPADVELLAAAAKIDNRRGGPYVVKDVRIGNFALAASSLITALNLTWRAPNSPPDAGVETLLPTFAARASGPSRSRGPASSDLTADGAIKPGGVSGCEVCVNLDPTDSYLWFVLPPEAMAAQSVFLHTDSATYGIASGAGQYFYTPAPAAYSSQYYVDWE